MALTAREIESAKPAPGKVLKLSDNGAPGLFCLVTSNGSKSWHLRIRDGKKDTTVSLGASYPDTSPKEARTLAVKKRAELETAKPATIDKESAAPTFGDMLKEFGRVHMASKSLATRTRFDWLCDFLAPLKGKPIDSIEPPDVLAVVRAVEVGGRHETAHRALALIARVFSLALSTGKAKRNPAKDINPRDALVPVNTEHHSAITDPKQFGELLRAMAEYSGRGASLVPLALELLALTAVRPGELRGMRYRELNLDAAEPIWTIPADRMKLRRDHIVPLSPQALNILKSAQMYANDTDPDSFVFGSRPHRPLSENTFSVVLAAIGYKDRHTAHGYRSSFRSICSETNLASREILELCLAHALPGLDPVYMRSERLADRRAAMIAWADLCDSMRGRKSGLSS